MNPDRTHCRNVFHTISQMTASILVTGVGWARTPVSGASGILSSGNGQASDEASSGADEILWGPI